MRKNAVVKEVTRAEGGADYPRGIRAVGESGEKSFVFVDSETKGVFACSFGSRSLLGGYRRVADKRLLRGVDGIAVLLGGTDIGTGETEIAAKMLCEAIEKKFNKQNVLPLFVGESGKREKYERLSSLVSDSDFSDSVAASLGGKEGAFSFYLGDFLCRIGYAYCEENACFLIATDVAVSREMLSRVLETEVREVFSVLFLPFLPTASDVVAIVASGAAGNASIDREDGDYKKFSSALHAACVEIATSFCRENNRKCIECVVRGALSKKTARSVAKSVATSLAVRSETQNGYLTGQSVLNAIAYSGVPLCAEEISVSLVSENGNVHPVENGMTLAGASRHTKAVLSGEESFLCIRLGNGNYGASAWFAFEKE